MSLVPLDVEATIDPDLALVLVDAPCYDLIVQVFELISTTCDELSSNSKSEAYISLRRAINILNIMRESDNFNEFNMLSGFFFSNRFFKELNFIIYKLGCEITQHNTTEATTSDATSLASILSPFKDLDAYLEEYDCYKSIMPLRLIELAKTGVPILIIDTREDTKTKIDLKYSTEFMNTTLTYVHPKFLTPDLPLIYLSNTLPEDERSNFLIPTYIKFEYVVIISDFGPVFGADDELEAPVLYLMNALTKHNYLMKGKRLPIFLKGGFQQWSIDCPDLVFCDSNIHGAQNGNVCDVKDEENETLKPRNDLFQVGLFHQKMNELEMKLNIGSTKKNVDNCFVSIENTSEFSSLSNETSGTSFDTLDVDIPSTESQTQQVVSVEVPLDNDLTVPNNNNDNPISTVSQCSQFSSITLEFTRHNDVIVRADDTYSGKVVYPAYISFKSNVPIVGKLAKNDYKNHPDFVLYDIPMLLSKDFNPEKPNPTWRFTTSIGNDGNLIIHVGTVIITPFVAFGVLLKAILDAIQQHYPKSLDCVNVKLPVAPQISEKENQNLNELLNVIVVFF